jgi:hypothetical protein
MEGDRFARVEVRIRVVWVWSTGPAKRNGAMHTKLLSVETSISVVLSARV